MPEAVERVVLFRSDLGPQTLVESLEPAWSEIEHRYGLSAPRPLFADQQALATLIERALSSQSAAALPNLRSYLVVETPRSLGVDVVRDLLRIEGVEAYGEPGPVDPPQGTPVPNPRASQQGYLAKATEGGIDAKYAWTVPGGDGAGQAFVDLERGWMRDHEDLTPLVIPLLPGSLSVDFEDHGTGVLGVVAARDNTKGCIGVVPALQSVRCVSQWRAGQSSVYSTSEAIFSALSTMKSGDVLLLEAQTSFLGFVDVPVEIEPAVFKLLQHAASAGVVVVEAAGNGGVDLGPFFQFASGQDSGAILVGAATSQTRSRTSTSCFGARVDCYAWGENIATLRASHTPAFAYTNHFDGTSGAAAIVAGAALAVQGMAQAGRRAKHFSPSALRAILRNPAYGTPSANPAGDQIGAMPDLQKIQRGENL